MSRFLYNLLEQINAIRLSYDCAWRKISMAGFGICRVTSTFDKLLTNAAPASLLAGKPRVILVNISIFKYVKIP